MYVVKRDGTKVPFDKTKIEQAINKALIEVDGELYESDTAADIANEIYEIISMKPGHTLLVEQIQDMVEEALMESERRDVARAYIRYRYKQEIARERKKEILNAVRAKLRGEKNEKQNANVDEQSFGGRTGEASGVITKSLALEDIISETARNNHNWNRIYIHDLDSYYVGMHNCLSIPFDDLLANGFNTRHTDVRPAGSVNTAFQLVAVIF
jgi:ribonucleoside-triphosphate reductase